MQVPLYEAKNRLSALIDKVEHGAEIVITRRGIPAAKLVPISPAFDRAKARTTADAILQASHGTSLAGLPDLTSEGRDEPGP